MNTVNNTKMMPYELGFHVGVAYKNGLLSEDLKHEVHQCKMLMLSRALRAYEEGVKIGATMPRSFFPNQTDVILGLKRCINNF